MLLGMGTVFDIGGTGAERISKALLAHARDQVSVEAGKTKTPQPASVVHGRLAPRPVRLSPSRAFGSLVPLGLMLILLALVVFRLPSDSVTAMRINVAPALMALGLGLVTVTTIWVAFASKFVRIALLRLLSATYRLLSRLKRRSVRFGYWWRSKGFNHKEAYEMRQKYSRLESKAEKADLRIQEIMSEDDE